VNVSSFRPAHPVARPPSLPALATALPVARCQISLQRRPSWLASSSPVGFSRKTITVLEGSSEAQPSVPTPLTTTIQTRSWRRLTLPPPLLAHLRCPAILGRAFGSSKTDTNHVALLLPAQGGQVSMDFQPFSKRPRPSRLGLFDRVANGTPGEDRSKARTDPVPTVVVDEPSKRSLISPPTGPHLDLRVSRFPRSFPPERRRDLQSGRPGCRPRAISLSARGHSRFRRVYPCRRADRS